MAEKLDLDALERLIEAALADGCQDVRVPAMPLSEFTKAQREIQRRMRQNDTAYMSGWNDGQRALRVSRAAGSCTEGDRCVCGGDLPRVREGCGNWRQGE